MPLYNIMCTCNKDLPECGGAVRDRLCMHEFYMYGDASIIRLSCVRHASEHVQYYH